MSAASLPVFLVGVSTIHPPEVIRMREVILLPQATSARDHGQTSAMDTVTPRTRPSGPWNSRSGKECGQGGSPAHQAVHAGGGRAERRPYATIMSTAPGDTPLGGRPPTPDRSPADGTRGDAARRRSAHPDAGRKTARTSRRAAGSLTGSPSTARWVGSGTGADPSLAALRTAQPGGQAGDQVAWPPWHRSGPAGARQRAAVRGEPDRPPGRSHGAGENRPRQATCCAHSVSPTSWASWRSDTGGSGQGRPHGRGVPTRPGEDPALTDTGHAGANATAQAPNVLKVRLCCFMVT